MSEISVIKRSGEREKFNIKKIKRVVGWALEGLEDVNEEEIINHFNFNYQSDGITTKQIHNSLIETCLDLISVETPEYDKVAGRLAVYQLRKDVWGSKNPPRLIDLIRTNVQRGFYDKKLLENYSVKEINKINEFINHDLDLNFSYGGIKQLIDKYFVQNRNTKEIVESAQFLYALVAMTLFAGEPKNVRLEYIRKAYDYFSRHLINLATPVLAGARTPLTSYASCALFDVGDSLNSIGAHDFLFKAASASRYGLGLNISRMRPINASIRGGDVKHTGLVPYLKNFESGIKSCHQNGIRGASGTVFIWWWHQQVEDVLVLKDNTRPDESAVRFLDYCLCFSKLFRERVEKNEKITLFNPNEVPELVENFGKEGWDELYLEREKDENISRKVVESRKIIGVFAQQRLATGRIYALDVDNINTQSPFLDPVRQSNLCVSSDSLLLTKNGNIEIGKLVDQNVEIWNGNEWSFAKVEKTGENKKLLTVETSTGEFIKCTPEHRWCIFKHTHGVKDWEYEEKRTTDLKVGDRVAKFEYSFDRNGWEVKEFYTTIKSVTDSGEYEDTFCVGEPLRGAVVFNNILTLNCMEILQPTNPSEKWNDQNGLIGCCILSAINPLNVKNDEEFEDACMIMVRMLDCLISQQSYFDLAVENFATKYRSLGIGVLNFAAYLAENNVFYTDPEAPAFAAQFAEKLSFYTIKASIELAKEKGKFEFFDKTRWSEGSLPIDRYHKGVDEILKEPLHMDWESLRAPLAEYGIRNSTLTAYMPVESSSVVSGATSGMEPIRDYIISKPSKAGKLISIAPNLKKNKAAYTLAFDMTSNEPILNIYAAMSKFTCMSLSANTYMNKEHFENGQISYSVIVKEIFDFFKRGGKTIYYNHTNDGGGSKYEEPETCSIGGGCTL